MTVRVYVEGGGDSRSTRDTCREGFRKLFGKVVRPGASLRVIASGGRGRAFENFCDGLRDHSDETVLLLVDSEGPVNGTVWEHLRSRVGDGWVRPASATEEHAYLMVQCMEAWFVADRVAVANYYGKGFHSGALPRQPNVEQIPKQRVQDALKRAARQTDKQTYHKTRDGLVLLGLIDAQKLRTGSMHAGRLFDALIRFTGESAAKCQRIDSIQQG